MEELSAINEQLAEFALGRRRRGQVRGEIFEQMSLIRAEKTIEISLATDEKGKAPLLKLEDARSRDHACFG